MANIRNDYYLSVLSFNSAEVFSFCEKLGRNSSDLLLVSAKFCKNLVIFVLDLSFAFDAVDYSLLSATHHFIKIFVFPASVTLSSLAICFVHLRGPLSHPDPHHRPDCSQTPFLLCSLLFVMFLN